MTLRITVVDEQTGHTESCRIWDGGYLLVCCDPCDLTHQQMYPTTGTVQLTLKNYRIKPVDWTLKEVNA